MMYYVITLAGSYVAFWGFFGGFSRHASLWRWLMLAIATERLIFFWRFAFHAYVPSFSAAALSCVIGAAGLFVCYGKSD